MIEEKPSGPRAFAEACAAKMLDLKEELAKASTRAERSSIRRRIRSCAMLEQWAKTRAGYR